MATTSTARPTRGRRAARPSGDDREAAILATATRLLEDRPYSDISVDDLQKGPESPARRSTSISRPRKRC